MKVNIYVPNALMEQFNHERPDVNLSRIFQEALARELNQPYTAPNGRGGRPRTKLTIPQRLTRIEERLGLDAS